MRIQGQAYGVRLALSVQVTSLIDSSHLTVPEFQVAWITEALHCLVNGCQPHSWLSSVGLQIFPSLTIRLGRILCSCHWILQGHAWDLTLTFWGPKHLSSRNRYNFSPIMPFSIQKQDLWWLKRQQSIVSDLSDFPEVTNSCSYGAQSHRVHPGDSGALRG